MTTADLTRYGLASCACCGRIMLRRHLQGRGVCRDRFDCAQAFGLRWWRDHDAKSLDPPPVLEEDEEEPRESPKAGQKWTVRTNAPPAATYEPYGREDAPEEKLDL